MRTRVYAPHLHDEHWVIIQSWDLNAINLKSSFRDPTQLIVLHQIPSLSSIKIKIEIEIEIEIQVQIISGSHLKVAEGLSLLVDRLRR